MKSRTGKVTFISLVAGAIAFTLFFIFEYALSSKNIEVAEDSIYFVIRNAFLLISAISFLVALIILAISTITTLFRK